MPRGHPDYNNYGYTNAFNETLQDDSYVAIRGLSPITNAGRVYFADYFSSGLGGWYKTSTGGGNNPVLQVTEGKAVISGYGVNMNPVVNGGKSQIEKRLHAVLYSKQGIELVLHPEADHGRIQIDCLYYVPGGVINWFTFGFDPLTANWFTGTNYTTGQFRTEAASGILGASTIRIKMIMNVVDGTFDQFFFGDEVYDLSTRVCSTQAAPDEGLVKIRIAAYGADATYKNAVYVSGFVWTVDEP